MAFALEKSRKVLRVKAKIALSRNNVVVVVAGVAVVFILSSSLLFVHSLAYIYIVVNVENHFESFILW